jgi:hypothetical protein
MNKKTISGISRYISIENTTYTVTQPFVSVCFLVISYNNNDLPPAFSCLAQPRYICKSAQAHIITYPTVRNRLSSFLLVSIQFASVSA